MDIIKIDELNREGFLDNFISQNIKNNILDVEVVYDSLFENAKILRNFVEKICINLWFSSLDVNRFILIVDELSNNAIEYWSEKWWINKLRLKTIKDWDSFDFFLELEDSWKWEKHKTALEMETMRAHQLKKWYDWHYSIRWRWLFMITVKSVDRLYFKDSLNWGLIVWVRKKKSIYSSE